MSPGVVVIRRRTIVGNALAVAALLLTSQVRGDETPLAEALELFDQKRFYQAISALDELAENTEDPRRRREASTLARKITTFATAWNAGTTALKRRQFGPAIREFERALKLGQSINPDSSLLAEIMQRRLAPTYVLHGNNSMKKSRYAEAYASFKKALLNKPDYGPARKGLRKLAAQAKRLHYEGYLSQYSDRPGEPAPLPEDELWASEMQPGLDLLEAERYEQAELSFWRVAAGEHYAPDIRNQANHLARRVRSMRGSLDRAEACLESCDYECAVKHLGDALEHIRPVRTNIASVISSQLGDTALAAAQSSLEQGMPQLACEFLVVVARLQPREEAVKTEAWLVQQMLPAGSHCRQRLEDLVDPTSLDPGWYEDSPELPWDQLDPELRPRKSPSPT